jgi:hypothetical protein
MTKPNIWLLARTLTSNMPTLGKWLSRAILDTSHKTSICDADVPVRSKYDFRSWQILLQKPVDGFCER